MSKIESDAARFFDRFAADFDTLYDGRRNHLLRLLDRRFRRDMFVRFGLTFEALGDLKGRTVLDVGCGSGPYVVEALERGAAHVTALDPADGMLALLTRKLAVAGLADRCTVVPGLFPGPALEPHDHVIAMGVMDYVADAGAFLAALRPLVKKGAALSFPSRHWFRTPLRRARYRLRRCPVFFYDADQIADLCHGAGFGGARIQKIAGAGLDFHVYAQP